MTNGITDVVSRAVASAASSAAPSSPEFIDIGTPRPAQREGRSFTAIGTSDVFEGAMQFRLRGPDGTLVRHGLIQATSGTGTPGFWHRTISLPTNAKGGDYQLTVFARSPMDGSICVRDQTTFHAPSVGGTGPGYDPEFIDAAPPQRLTLDGRNLRLIGTSNVFEGTMPWRVLDSNGHAVAHGMTTATSGSGTAGFWHQRIGLPNTVPAGNYRVVVRGTSGGDEGGSSLLPREVIPFTVR